MIRYLVALMILSTAAHAQGLATYDKIYIKHGLTHSKDEVKWPDDEWEIAECGTLQLTEEVVISITGPDSLVITGKWWEYVMDGGGRLLPNKQHETPPAIIENINTTKLKNGKQKRPFNEITVACMGSRGNIPHVFAVITESAKQELERQLNAKGYRTWTGTEGETLRGKLKRDGRIVTIETIEGEEVKIDKKKLSIPDRQWIGMNR